MVNKSTEKNEAKHSTKTPNADNTKSEPSTSSACHIKDRPIEQFTKVSNFIGDQTLIGVCYYGSMQTSQLSYLVFRILHGIPLQDGMGLIVSATKHTNAFPSNASRNLYSAYPAFNRAVQRHSDQIMSVISKVVKLQHIKGNIQR